MLSLAQPCTKPARSCSTRFHHVTDWDCPEADVMECPLQAGGGPPAPSPCPGKESAAADTRLAVVLVTAAGLTVLLLLYRLLQLRHRLRVARARHALEYYGFYHSATYRLPHVPLYEDEPKTGPGPGPGPGPAPGTSLSPPAIVVTSLPPVPAPPTTRPSPAQATPPSPHLSWGRAPMQTCTPGLERFDRPASPVSPTNHESSCLSTPLSD
ncbi:hypothetical protein WMY93_021067 [Mugilogobius chulae]|uniref:Uncharacterized protein n=1 Tax=Mugilogobius chulae TaxID=88201 RepID=A0AAW0NK66_9GOBI